MSTINNVGINTTQSTQGASTAYQNPQSTAASEKQNEDSTEVAEDQFIKSQQENTKSATYSKPTYKPDLDKINELKAQLKNNMGAFQMMVDDMKTKGTSNGMWGEGSVKDWVSGVISGQITYDAETINKAKEAISEDGEWGVEAVSDRIVEFAKALSGGDMEQYDKLLGAIKKGFGAAADEWGRKMPDITKQTYDRTMEKMEEWKKGAADASTTTQDAVVAASGVAAQ